MEGHYGTRISFFKFEGIISELNNLGYKHFLTNDKFEDKDFKNGIGFYIDTKYKVYGKAHIYNSVTPEYLKSQLGLHIS